MKSIYVKVIKNKSTENFFKFGCTGYGWIKEDSLNKEFINVQCEDNYKGARGFTVDRSEIEICETQKENPYE